MSIEPSTTEPLTFIERIERRATKEANALADTFDLRDCLQLESFGLSVDDNDEEIPLIRLPYVLGKRGEEARIEIDDLTEAVRDWIREVLPRQIAGEIWARHMHKDNSDIDVESI